MLHIIGGDWGKDPEYSEDGYISVACVRGTEFKNWLNDLGKTAVERKIKVSSLNVRNLQADDILLEISGGGPEQPVGRTVLIQQRVLEQFSMPVVATNFLRLMRPVRIISSSFINRYLEFFYHSGEVINYQGGSNNLRNLKFKEYARIAIPMPPLAEQQVIADKLDTLLAQVESTKARLERIPQILKRFRQSVLAAAVSGELTEAWREGKKLNATIIKHNKKLEPIGDNEKYFDAPNSWSWSRLGSVVRLINGDRGKNYPNQSEYVEEGIPFINTGHIEPNGTLSAKRMNFITKEKYDSLGSGKIIINDLVYCLRGATMGKTARVTPFDTGAIASSLVIVRPETLLLTNYCFYFLISPEARKLIFHHKV